MISLGITNAFIAGVSRLGYSLAKDHWLPTGISRISRTGVPTGGILAVSGVAAVGLALAGLRGWGTETLVLVPSTLVVAVYVITAAAAVRVLTGWGRAAAVATLMITTVVVPAAIEHALIPVAVAAVALVSRAVFRPRPAAPTRDR